jgi:glutamate-5-semialdehyde dehydrogenase
MDSILSILQAANATSIHIRNLSDELRKNLLLEIAEELIHNMDGIIEENLKDLERMDDANPKKDRLLLTRQRILDIADATKDIANLNDPLHKVLYEYTPENGIRIQKITVPLGVVGVIYESRPNVTIDVAALCLRGGNAVVLRGGSDAEFSNKFLVSLIHRVLERNTIPKEVVTLLPTDRKYIQTLLEADKYVDIIIPRGSQELIDYVRLHSRVPTIETGAGVCHTYVENTADLDMAAKIVVNAKTHRPSVCNALDTVLVDESVALDFLPRLLEGFLAYKVEIFADENSFEILSATKYPYLHKATQENYGIEYLSQKCSIKCVKDIEEALIHIYKYSSKHSEAIVTSDLQVAERFLNDVDAAAVYFNASTRFTDGGIFGLGAEVGISTQKLHARGPFALEKLVTEKWVIHGSGQIR